MWSELRKPIVIILIAFLALFAYTRLFGPIPFSVNSVTTQKTNLFTVEGKGELTAAPDTALLNIGVSKTQPTVLQAQDQVNAIINQITAEVKKLGIEQKDIKTVTYSVNPNYDYSNGSQKINGYEVVANLQIKSKPIDKTNQMIDAATKAGATQIGNIQFVLNDDMKKELESKARKQAIDEAKAKAQSISSASGIHLGKIVDVQETGTPEYTYDRPVAAMGMLKTEQASAPATELQPGENKITSQVSISYETY